MIIDIRRHLQGHAYRFVVILAVIGIIISFALPPVIKQIGRDSEWVISINGTEISERTFRHTVSQQQEFLISFRQQWGAYADTLLDSMGAGRDPKELAFSLLVKQELLVQVAKSLGIVVHPDEIVQNLSNPQFVQRDLGSIIPPYFVSENGSINEKALRRYLQKIGITVGQFETLVRDAVARRMASQLAYTMAYVPLFDIRQRYIADFVPKKFSIATISLDSYLKKEKSTSISESDLQAYFDAQNASSSKYIVPEKRAGIMWTFEPASYGFKISEKDIESYYDAHKTTDYIAEPTRIQIRRILLKIPDESKTVEVENLAQKIRQELNLGDSFESKAKEVSQDAATAKQGGLLSYFARGEQDPALERVAFLLKNDGEISPVFRSNEGFEIIQRVAKKMRTFKPLSTVSGAIKTQLMKEKFKHQFMADMKAIASKPGNLDEHIASFVKEQSGKKRIIPSMSNDKSPLARTLFSIATLNGLDCYIDGENGIAVQLTSVQERFTPTLDSIKETVQQDMYRERAFKHLQQDMAQITTQEESQGLGAKVEKTGWITANSNKELKDLEARGISTQKILQLENIGAKFVDITEQHGFVVTLIERESIDEQKFEAESSKIRQTLEAERASLAVEGFIASLYRTAKLKTNESVLNLYQEYSI